MKPLIKIILALSIALLIFHFFRDELVFHRELINKGQWWRIVSGNFVHSNYPHLFLNTASLLIFAFIFMDTFKVKTFIITTFTLSIFIGICLYLFNPELSKYYGLSGVLYGLYICGAISTILQKDYFTGVSILLLIPGKIIWDHFSGGNISSEKMIGMPIAVEAHLYGLLGAVIISAFFIWNRKNSANSVS